MEGDGEGGSVVADASGSDCAGTGRESTPGFRGCRIGGCLGVRPGGCLGGPSTPCRLVPYFCSVYVISRNFAEAHDRLPNSWRRSRQVSACIFAPSQVGRSLSLAEGSPVVRSYPAFDAARRHRLWAKRWNSPNS